MAKNSKARKARARKAKAKQRNEEVTNEEPETMKLSELTLNNSDPLELSENDLDPVIYFSRFLDIPWMIFQHLKFKDLLKISEVSSTWYNFISSSKVLMKKIKIVFNDIRTLHQEDYDLLKNSSRLYESIELRGDSIQNGCREKPTTNFFTKREFKFFFEKTHEWKEIGIVNILFKNELDLWELLSAMQSTVERLIVDGVRFKKSLTGYNLATGSTSLVFSRPSLISTYNYWEFPKLKEVTLVSSEATVGTILSEAVAVEKLELRNVSTGVSIKMLKTFDKLTSLKLYVEDMLRIFETEDWIEFQFKLKSFTLNFKDSLILFKRLRVSKENVCYNFPNFLLSQSDHLEELFDVTEFDPSCYRGSDKYLKCFNLIMRMPNLKRLGLRYFPNLTENDGNFYILKEISSTITELRLEETPCAASFKFLLNSMPNLKKLQIFSFNQELFETIEAMERKFDELIVTNLEISLNNVNHILINEDWKEIQFKLKRLSIGSENEQCIWILMENARENLQNFLKSQSDHLEELSMELTCDGEILNLIMKMRKLKSLSLKRFSVFSTDEGPTEISTSITDFKTKQKESADLNVLLKSMPNVKRLKIYKIDQEIFETLVAMNRKFEELGVHDVREIDEESLKEISDNITKFYKK